ncbi:MAG: hypothetical protein WA303_09970 [Bradyrhizobium sp.]|jgi:hypothetical protein
MGHQRAYRAAVDGKRRGSKADRMAGAPIFIRRLILAAVTLFAVAVFGSSSYAQSGPFTGLAGFWSGTGTVTLDDGSTERIRCRASYAVGDNGAGLNQTLVCASDSYKFDLKTNVIAERGSLSGTWSESSRGVNGNIEGRGSNGNFQVVASAPGFTASISLTTRGNRQSVVIKSENGFRSATISLIRS